MSRASADIQGIFNRIAPVYDRLNDRLSFGLHRIWKQMAVKWSGAGPGDVCLDLCCGSGVQGIVALRYYASSASFVARGPEGCRG